MKPVFIIGCPRSGTSLMLDLMAFHESYAWVSNIINRNPDKPELSLLNRIYDIPFLGKFLYCNKGKTLGNRQLPYPVEPWRFWNKHLKNFVWEMRYGNSPRRHSENDISPEEVVSIIKIISAICRYQNKNEFLSKYTDFPRIKYFVKAFPNAIFIHLLRDGRAVAYSYYNKIVKGEFGTWKDREWWIQEWPESWRNEWIEKYDNPLGLVAFQWKLFVSEIWKDSQCIPHNQYLEINYRDLINFPKTT